MSIVSLPRRDIFIFSALVLASIGMRFYSLGSAPFSGDEWFTVLKAEERFSSIVNPLYYGFTLLSFKIFGFSEWASRVPAAVFGLLAPPVFFLLWRGLLGRLGAFILAIIILLSAWHLEYSQFSRFYSGVFLFGGLAYYAFWRAFTDGSWRALIGAILSTVVAASFHLTAVMVAGSVAVFAILVLSTRSRFDFWPSNAIKMSRIIAGFAFVTGIIALPFLWGVASGWAASDQPYGYGSIGAAFQLVKYIGPGISVAAGLGLLVMFKKQPAQAVFFGSAIGVPAIALILGAAITYVRPDYVFYSIPLWYVLAAYLCIAVYDLAKDIGIARNVIFALIIIGMVPETVSYYTSRTTLDYRDAISYLEREYEKGDEILDFVGGLKGYGDEGWIVREKLPYVYDDNARWGRHLKDLRCTDHRVWIFVPIRRGPLAAPLRGWLFDRAVLKWRVTAKRYDYSVLGYELFLNSKCDVKETIDG